jgi:hypothetical protein
MSDDWVMGDLAGQDAYDPMTGIPIGAPQTGGNLLGGLAGRIGSQAEYMACRAPTA